MSIVSLKFLIKKCPGKPPIPPVGTLAVFLQAGQMTWDLSALVLCHLSKHSKQKPCRHGRPTGSVSCSKQMAHARKSLSIVSAKLLAVAMKIGNLLPLLFPT